MIFVDARPVAGGESEVQLTVPPHGRAPVLHEREVEASVCAVQHDLAGTDHTRRCERERPRRLHSAVVLYAAGARDYLKRRTSRREIPLDPPIKVEKVLPE